MSFIELTGHAKLDRRTKNLIKRLSADDIAIIDHTDLDRVSAEELVECGVRVVINHIGLDENIPGNLGKTSNKVGN